MDDNRASFTKLLYIYYKLAAQTNTVWHHTCINVVHLMVAWNEDDELPIRSHAAYPFPSYIFLYVDMKILLGFQTHLWHIDEEYILHRGQFHS